MARLVVVRHRVAGRDGLCFGGLAHLGTSDMAGILRSISAASTPIALSSKSSSASSGIAAASTTGFRYAINTLVGARVGSLRVLVRTARDASHPASRPARMPSFLSTLTSLTPAPSRSRASPIQRPRAGTSSAAVRVRSPARARQSEPGANYRPAWTTSRSPGAPNRTSASLVLVSAAMPRLKVPESLQDVVDMAGELLALRRRLELDALAQGPVPCLGLVLAEHPHAAAEGFPVLSCHPQILLVECSMGLLAASLLAVVPSPAVWIFGCGRCA